MALSKEHVSGEQLWECSRCGKRSPFSSPECQHCQTAGARGGSVIDIVSEEPHASGARLVKGYMGSALRRGRRSTVATWLVHTPSGECWRFNRKRDAVSFIEAGCVCADHARILCRNCNGYRATEFERTSADAMLSAREGK